MKIWFIYFIAVPLCSKVIYLFTLFCTDIHNLLSNIYFKDINAKFFHETQDGVDW